MVAEAGAIPPLVKLLTNGFTKDAKCVAHASWALANIAADAPAQVRLHLLCAISANHGLVFWTTLPCTLYQIYFPGASLSGLFLVGYSPSETSDIQGPVSRQMVQTGSKRSQRRGQIATLWSLSQKKKSKKKKKKKKKKD